MKIQIETAHKADNEKEDESILEDLCQDLLKNGIESVIENFQAVLLHPY